MVGVVSQIDHVVYGVRDLDKAAMLLREEFGLDAVPGHSFPGIGAANRVVALGDQYLELFAIVDADEARTTGLGRWLLSRLKDADTFLAWALPTDNLDAVADRLGLDPQHHRMTGPDGGTLTWRLVGMGEAFAEPGLPFFIEWDDPAEFAATLGRWRESARHATESTGIDWIEISGDEGRIRDRMGTTDAPVRITPGPPSIMAIGVATPHGGFAVRQSGH